MLLLLTPDTAKASHIARACGRDVPFHHVDQASPDPATVVNFVDNNAVDVAVIGPEIEPKLGRTIAKGLIDRHPFLGVILFVDDSPQSLREALRIGVTDVVGEEMPDDEVALVIEAARDRVARRREAGNAALQTAESVSRVMTLFSPRGGVGRTLLATSLASTLERQFPGEVVLVDLDLQGGDAAPMLGLNPHLSISSISSRVDDLDSADVKAVLTKDQDGLHLLAAPPTLTGSVEVSPAIVASMLDILSSSFRFVVLDTGTYVSEVTLAALDSTTDLLLVCAPDVPSVRALGRATDALDELRIIAPRRHLIVNKATARYGMPLRDIEAVSGMTAIAQVPASKEIAMALNRGTPFHEVVHPRSVVPKAMKGLLGEIAPEPTSSGGRRRLLGLGR